jgi:glutaredoxin
MKRVMYVKPGCPYCQEARDAMAADGLEWVEVDATRDALYKKQLMRHSKNTGTVPTIVMGDEVVTIGWKGRG